MKTTSYILLNKKKKISNYHQITHLICFSVLIINFADINNFPLSSPYLLGCSKSPRISYLYLLMVIMVLCNPNYVFNLLADNCPPEFFFFFFFFYKTVTCKLS